MATFDLPRGNVAAAGEQTFCIGDKLSTKADPSASCNSLTMKILVTINFDDCTAVLSGSKTMKTEGVIIR